ncbi:MAG: GNAT family N-acetyltransferase [Bacteroidales bacterium]
MIDIKRIRILELNELVSSPSYAEWEVVPISRHRAKSYINNPRSISSDVVMYLAYMGNKLVGYRTILPDEIFSNNERVRVGWLSGNWVHPQHRREGVSTELFNAAYSDWEGMLLYTNYAPESKAVYDKTSRFSYVNSCLGRRFYLRSCLRILLPPKGHFYKLFLPVWYLADFLFSIFNPLPFITKHLRLGKDVTFEYLSKPDDELLSAFHEFTSRTLTKRSKEELLWISEYPWLVSSPLGDRIGTKYFFSSAPKRFDQFFVKVYLNGRFAGFLIGNLNNRMFSVPYVYCSEDDSLTFSKIILKHAGKLNAAFFTVFNKNISNKLKGVFPFGLLSLSQKRNFYVTTNLHHHIQKEEKKFIEGDGDSVFV